MSKEEKREYWTKEELHNEVLEHIEVQTSNGKWLIFKRLTKGEEKDIRKKTMKMVKNPKTGVQEPTIDTEEYQVQLLSKAIVKPKLTLKEVQDMVASQRADEIFMLYSEKIGFAIGDISQNL
jgi:hypothetical protein